MYTQREARFPRNLCGVLPLSSPSYSAYISPGPQNPFIFSSHSKHVSPLSLSGAARVRAAQGHGGPCLPFHYTMYLPCSVTYILLSWCNISPLLIPCLLALSLRTHTLTQNMSSFSLSGAVRVRAAQGDGGPCRLCQGHALELPLARRRTGAHPKPGTGLLFLFVFVCISIQDQ